MKLTPFQLVSMKVDLSCFEVVLQTAVQEAAREEERIDSTKQQQILEAFKKILQ